MLNSMRIDPKSNVPIFRQIADQLRGRIRRGVHRPGEMLPSLRVLALEIQVNPNTVQRAYELLEREGVVESQRGVGIFVSTREDPHWSDTEQKLHEYLEAALEAALENGMKPERLRNVFEDALHKLLQRAQT